MFKIGLLVQKGGFWIGAHYSPFNRRVCINLVPFVTIWVALPDGKTPFQCRNASDYKKVA